MREGALGTVVTLTDTTTHTDRRGSSFGGQVQALRVDQPVCMSQLAPQPNREGLTGLAVSGCAALNGARDPQVVASVGHLGHLDQDLAGVTEGLVDVP